MKKKSIYIIIITAVIILILGGAFYYFFNKKDANTTLTIIEKQWVENNKNKIFDFGVVNDIPLFSYNGKGIFLDFMSSLETDVGLEFNKMSYEYGKDSTSQYKFQIVPKRGENDILLYQDNYVLISKENIKYNNISDIKDKTIGVLNSDLDSTNTYLFGADNVSFKTYDDANTLIDALISSEDLNMIVLPKTIYMDKLLSDESLTIAYNISDYTLDYVITLGSEQKLNDILLKYFNKWYKENFVNSYNTNFSSSYFEFSKVDDKQIAEFNSKSYNYGFVEYAPFDKLVGNKLKGVNNAVIKQFASIANIEINYEKYNSIKDLLNSFNSNNIDFFFGNNSDIDYKMDVFNTNKLMTTEIAIVSHNTNKKVINSFNSLLGNDVIVIEGSIIESYLKSLNINVISYKNINTIFNEINKDSIIALDLDSFNYYKNNKLSNYKLNYSNTINESYSFVLRDISDNKVFNSFFSFYVSFIDDKRAMNEANYELLDTEEKNINYINIISYILSIGFIILLSYNIYKGFINKEKRNKNFNKEDKIKYIDMLTSLKNRNYLNENMEEWDNSEIYPQAVVIVDLNNIAYINDNYGHQEGDNVIKEAASILIRTQIENTEIIRTNGNEFLIYMLNYDEKQVVNYIRKLNKELKNLAHGFGAAAGYSMITDGIKTIDDAINEATIDMRSNKEEINN